MSGIFLRWGVPALVTVIGGTALAITLAGPAMTEDLAGRTAEAIASPQFGWANVTIDGRDAILGGTATDQSAIDAALVEIAAVPGVRSARSAVTLAKYVSPFPFRAVVTADGISLSGGIPDEEAHRTILAAAGPADDNLRLLSGAPARAEWLAAVSYAIAHLRQFDEGEAVLSDLDLTISGRARSPDAFDQLAVLETEAPAGAAISRREITPPLASPFEWQASFNGKAIAVSGFTPSYDFAESLRRDGIGGKQVATSLVLASGAPEGFETKARTVLENLVLLEEGTAQLVDGKLELEGAPADRATADRVREAMEPLGATVTLAPPRIDTYDFVATRTGDAIALQGHVPNETTRQRLNALEGVDATALELARGAPARLDSAIDFGLDLLRRMSEGRFAISNTSLTVEGRALTVADFTEIETKIALGAPQGLILASAQVKPPLATPFTWSAAMGEDGRVRLEGFVPSEPARARLREAVASLGADSMTLADGDPPDFERLANAALSLLALFDHASVSFDGSNWSISGFAETSQQGFAAEQAFLASPLKAVGASLDVTLPEAPVAAALPIIDPYVWRAQKTSHGAIALGGFVPTDELRRVLVRRAGTGAVDNTSLGAGQPEGFIAATLVGMDALNALDEGTLSFDGRAWSLTGQVGKASERLAVEAMIDNAVDTAQWRIAIQAVDAAPVAAPYRWSATKAADGRVSLAGYVATDELKQFIAVRAGTIGIDATEVASGEPAGFVGDVLAGLEALNHLTMGTVKYEDGGWTLAGVPETPVDADLALAALGTATAGGASWQKQLSEPMRRSAPEETPAVEPVTEPAEPEPSSDQPQPESTTEPEAPTAAPVAPQESLPVQPPEAAESAPEPAVADTPEAPIVRDFVFSATKPLGGTIVLDGQVPADATRRFFGVIAGEVPTDNLVVGGELPSDFIPVADAGIRLLADLESGEFGLDGDTWVLNGRVESAARRTEVMQSLAATPVAADWQTDISLLPPIDVCRQHVAAFANRNAILFQSGSAQLADESAPAVDELADYLSACPEATVHVEGHTDSDGGDDLNLALSVARAEAVVEALIERGVDFRRLYAVGYGASLPIADNDTAAGKRANRRIAFTILDEGG